MSTKGKRESESIRTEMCQGEEEEVDGRERRRMYQCSKIAERNEWRKNREMSIKEREDICPREEEEVDERDRWGRRFIRERGEKKGNGVSVKEMGERRA